MKTLHRLIIILSVVLLFTVKASASKSALEIHVLDVGDGQAVLVESGHRYLMIDGGGRKSSSFVVCYLEEQKVSKLDYVIATDFGNNRLPGLVGVLTKFGAGRVLMPPGGGEDDLFDSFAATAVKYGDEISHITEAISFQLGETTIDLTGHDIRISYGNTSFGFGSEEADLNVVNGKGSSELAGVRQVIISGYPEAELLDTLQMNESVQMYRTDKQGTIVAYSDGDNIWIDKFPCEDWTIEEHPVIESEVDEPVTRNAEDNSSLTYVCNINTMRFHYPNCRSVGQMKEKNKLYSDLTRDELIAEGYEPCGNCNP